MKTVIVTFMFSLLVIVNSQVTLNLFITACKGIGGKVMFSQVYICMGADMSREVGIHLPQKSNPGYQMWYPN